MVSEEDYSTLALTSHAWNCLFHALFPLDVPLGQCCSMALF